MLIKSQRSKSVFLIWLICFASMIATLNCSQTGTASKNSITKSSESLVSLESRVKESIAYINSQNWIELHEYQNPKLREQRFPFGLEIAQPCSQETFIYNMVSVTEKIKSKNNLPERMKLDFQLDTISIDSVTNTGKAVINTYFDNEKTLIFRFEQRWVYRENQWWHHEENMQKTCEELGKDLN